MFNPFTETVDGDTTDTNLRQSCRNQFCDVTEKETDSFCQAKILKQTHEQVSDCA